MPDTKITALAAITTVDPAADVLPIVDISDTSMAASGTTKKITSNQILGAGGTATLASATITGDLTAHTTGLTVNSSGVGIGTNSQSSFLGNSPKKLVIGDGTQTPALTLYGGSANVCGLYFADGTVGNQAYRGYVEYDHNTDSFGLGISGSLAMTLNSTGLGVGASPLGKFDVYNTGSDTTTFIRSDTTRLGQIVFRDNADSANQGRVKYDHSTDTLSLFSGGNENVFLSSSGNVGIGVTPSAWNSTVRALQIGGVGALYGSTATTGAVSLSRNAYDSATGGTYISNDEATLYEQDQLGRHVWYNAPAGTGAITWTQAMTLDASGRLILLASTTTPATLSTNGQLTFTATSNTNLRFSYRGSDGVTRTADLTLA